MKFKELKRELREIPLVDPPEELHHRVRQTISKIEGQSPHKWWNQPWIFVTGAAACFLIGIVSLMNVSEQKESPLAMNIQLTTQQSRIFDLSGYQLDIFQVSGLETSQVSPEFDRFSLQE